MKNRMSRRDFLQHSAAAVTTASAWTSSLASSALQGGSDGLPRRVLGKTGLKVSLLGFGGGSQWLKVKDGEWEPILERAVDLGINYFDTAPNYKWGATRSSEERFGEILPPHRKSVFLATKIDSRDVTEGMKVLEKSMKAMKADYLDVLLLHSVGEKDKDIAALEKGVYGEIRKLKEAGTARFIGFSSMNDGARTAEFIEALNPDVALLAMNATKYGDVAAKALPAARQKDVGIVAMKAMRDIVGAAAKPKELLDYVWSHPGVATLLVGHVSVQMLEENVQSAQSFAAGQTDLDAERLEKRVAHLAGPHALCWARPDYVDWDFNAG